MNMLERQSQVAREVTQINIDAMRALMQLSARGLERYMALNEDYFRQIAQPDGVQGFVTLQQTYGRSLFSGISEDLKARAEVVRDAFEQTRTAVREGWGEGDSTLADEPTESAIEVEAVAEPAGDAVAEAAVPARATVEVTAVPAVDHEDLQQIDGIGGVFAEELRSAGILTIAQLASIRIEDLEGEGHPLHALKGRMASEDWIEQAQMLLRS